MGLIKPQKLPTLSKPATAGLISKGYEAISQDRKIITGTLVPLATIAIANQSSDSCTVNFIDSKGANIYTVTVASNKNIVVNTSNINGATRIECINSNGGDAKCLITLGNILKLYGNSVFEFQIF